MSKSISTTPGSAENHYFIERPSYPPETRNYYADLDKLGSIQNWTARDLYVNLIGLVYLCVGLFVIFKQGGRSPFVLHFALSAWPLSFSISIRLPEPTRIWTWRLPSCAAWLHHVRAPVFALQRDLSRSLYLLEARRWRSVVLYLPLSFCWGLQQSSF